MTGDRFLLAFSVGLILLREKVRSCVACGESFWPVKRQIRCGRSECTRASGRERSKAWYERNREVANRQRRAARADRRSTSEPIEGRDIRLTEDLQ